MIRIALMMMLHDDGWRELSPMSQDLSEGRTSVVHAGVKHVHRPSSTPFDHATMMTTTTAL